MKEIQDLKTARKEQNPEIAEKLFSDFLKNLPRNNPTVTMMFHFSNATHKIKTEKKVTSDTRDLLENALIQSENVFLGDTQRGDDQRLLQYVLDAANAFFTHEAYELAWRLYLRASRTSSDCFPSIEDRLEVFYYGMQALCKLPDVSRKSPIVDDFHDRLYQAAFNASNKALELLMFNGTYYLQKNKLSFAEEMFFKGIQLTQATELEYFVKFRLKWLLVRYKSGNDSNNETAIFKATNEALKSATNKTKAIANYLLEFSKQLLNYNYAQTLQLLKIAEDYTEDTILKNMIYLETACLHISVRNYQQALPYLNSALEARLDSNPNNQLANQFLRTAIMLYGKNYTDKTNALFSRAQSLCKTPEDEITTRLNFVLSMVEFHRQKNDNKSDEFIYDAETAGKVKKLLTIKDPKFSQVPLLVGFATKFIEYSQFGLASQIYEQIIQLEQNTFQYDSAIRRLECLKLFLLAKFEDKLDSLIDLVVKDTTEGRYREGCYIANPKKTDLPNLYLDILKLLDELQLDDPGFSNDLYKLASAVVLHAQANTKTPYYHEQEKIHRCMYYCVMVLDKQKDLQNNRQLLLHFYFSSCQQNNLQDIKYAINEMNYLYPSLPLFIKKETFPTTLFRFVVDPAVPLEDFYKLHIAISKFAEHREERLRIYYELIKCGLNSDKRIIKAINEQNREEINYIATALFGQIHEYDLQRENEQLKKENAQLKQSVTQLNQENTNLQAKAKELSNIIGEAEATEEANLTP